MAASDASLLVIVADAIGREASARVHALFSALSASPPPWLENLHPAYTSVLVAFDPAQARHEEVERWVCSVDLPRPVRTRAERVVEVPVRYDGADLPDVAAHTALSIEDVIRRHAAPTYLVAFVGFQPGFAYLLGLDPALAVPRLATPRVRVPAGSVAIGGLQTGVYPAESPGGWRLVGHTRRPLPPDWVAPGDQVRFISQ